MKQRYNAPFGYKMENGGIVVNEAEAAAVREVFRLYLEGDSYSAIAGKMTVPYSDGKAWNKNMVARILENRKYLGEMGYPALVSQQDFQQAGTIKSEKNSRKDRVVPELATLLTGRVVCERCGQWFQRRHDSRVSPKWICRSGCETDVRITDTLLENAVVAGLNRLIENPSLILEPEAGPEVYSLEITRLTNELNRELAKADFDEATAVSRMFELAAKRYELCGDGSGQRESAKLRELFSRMEPIKHFDGGLFGRAVRRLLISGTGAVSLQLTNGQVLFPNQGGIRNADSITAGGRNTASETGRRAGENQTATA